MKSVIQHQEEFEYRLGKSLLLALVLINTSPMVRENAIHFEVCSEA
jgi:hypothetical protein